MTNTFTSRKELENWIESESDKTERKFYWGQIENLDEWYSLNELKADISDDWFTDPNGKKLEVTIYEREEA